MSGRPSGDASPAFKALPLSKVLGVDVGAVAEVSAGFEGTEETTGPEESQPNPIVASIRHAVIRNRRENIGNPSRMWKIHESKESAIKKRETSLNPRNRPPEVKSGSQGVSRNNFRPVDRTQGPVSLHVNCFFDEFDRAIAEKEIEAEGRNQEM